MPKKIPFLFKKKSRTQIKFTKTVPKTLPRGGGSRVCCGSGVGVVGGGVWGLGVGFLCVIR